MVLSCILSLCFSVLIALWLPWVRELLCAFHAFFCFACVGLCLFPLPLGIRHWLRLVIVALPELFCLPITTRLSVRLVVRPSIFYVHSQDFTVWFTLHMHIRNKNCSLLFGFMNCLPMTVIHVWDIWNMGKFTKLHRCVYLIKITNKNGSSRFFHLWHTSFFHLWHTRRGQLFHIMYIKLLDLEKQTWSNWPKHSVTVISKKIIPKWPWLYTCIKQKQKKKTGYIHV